MIVVMLLRSAISSDEAREHIAAFMRASMAEVAEQTEGGEDAEGNDGEGGDAATAQTTPPPRVFEETVAHGIEKILALKESGEDLEGAELEAWSTSLLAAATHVEAGLACSAFTFSHVIAAWGAEPAEAAEGEEKEAEEDKEAEEGKEEQQEEGAAAEAGEGGDEEGQTAAEEEQELPVQSKIALSLLSMTRKVLLESKTISQLAATAAADTPAANKLCEAISMSCECLGRIVSGDKVARAAAQDGEHEDCCVDALLNVIKAGAGRES